MNLPALPTIYERYEKFGRLAQDSFSGSLASKLLLRSRLDADGIADIVAASVAGACSLCVEPDADTAREALRAGLCDFVVGPLDEALRILKNELRRGRAISVGVTADADSMLAEMLDRGLQPDLVSLPAGEPGQTFVRRGAAFLAAHSIPEPGTTIIDWTIAADAARSMPQVARTAAQALDASRSDTPMRQRWLEIAPRRLGRAFAAHNCVRMTPAEASAFVAAARVRFPAVHIKSDGSAL